MAAATTDRATRIRHPEGSVHRVVYPVKGSTTIFKGTLVALTAGYLAPAADAAGAKVVGVAQEKVVNAGADGAKTCAVDSGAAWEFAASSVAAADVGKTAYVVDDQTVGDATGTNSIVAGVIEERNAAGTKVWVRIQPVT
jgi:hypothetical protein